jgi:hypothetical protein
MCDNWSPTIGDTVVDNEGQEWVITQTTDEQLLVAIGADKGTSKLRLTTPENLPMPVKVTRLHNRTSLKGVG